MERSSLEPGGDRLRASADGLPSVDVIIAARNEEAYLRQCLESLAAQRYPAERLRVYVVDNGSSDATGEVAERFPAERLSVRLLRQSRAGAAAARNAGIAAGEGELLAFLDAHCVVNDCWVSALASRFDETRLGGCQGRTDCHSVSPRVERFLVESGELSDDRIIEDTVSGKRNIYPWILSGNSMYRRSAVEEAGGFDEALRTCEDVDLAWRVVLLGYHLGYEARSIAVHYDTNSWYRYIRKGLTYGAGASVLARIYRPHGARNKFLPAKVWRGSVERSLSGLYYAAGYWLKDFRIRVAVDPSPVELAPREVRSRFRPWFRWTGDAELRVSPHAIFWFRDVGESTSVIVHIPSRTRTVLTEAGDFIWRRLAAGDSRAVLAETMVTHYGISVATAISDLDELVEELVACELLNRRTVEHRRA